MSDRFSSDYRAKEAFDMQVKSGIDSPNVKTAGLGIPYTEVENLLFLRAQELRREADEMEQMAKAYSVLSDAFKKEFAPVVADALQWRGRFNNPRRGF